MAWAHYSAVKRRVDRGMCRMSTEDSYSTDRLSNVGDPRRSDSSRDEINGLKWLFEPQLAPSTALVLIGFA